MKLLEITFDICDENLALDEALLNQSEEKTREEVLRFWEPRNFFIVLGYSNSFRSEVKTISAKKDCIPLSRRCSGGGTVLQGPCCLNYSLILKVQPSGPTKDISKTNLYVLKKNKEALESVLPDHIDIEGTSDLAINNLKFSGNAQKRKKDFLLFHGTFLYNFNIPLIENYLFQPGKEPLYRKNRTHAAFLTNIPLSAEVIKKALQKEWKATKILANWPEKETRQMVKEKYSTKEWILRA